MGRYGWTITLTLVLTLAAAWGIAAFLGSPQAQNQADCTAHQIEVRAIPATGQNMDKMAEFGCRYGPTDRWWVV